MNQRYYQITILITLFLQLMAIRLEVIYPPELADKFPNNIPIHVSSIGFRPLSGRLDGITILATPSGACSIIEDVHSQNQDIFILADDSQCLQSVKAKNIANSGAYAAIIKQNINNTLHDKEITLVHIPVVEILPAQYDKLIEFMNQNPYTRVTLSLDFTDHSQTHPINLEVWFSPTQIRSYQFMFQIREFIDAQENLVSFTPHYVLQSQRETKNYVGCLSGGRYCPTQIQFQGKYEGKNIVEQTLRQLILWKMSPSLWWRYTEQFYNSCLIQIDKIFLNSTLLQYCSQNSMIIVGVDTYAFKKEYNNSFLGGVIQKDDNTYLLEERQKYIREQITTHPVGLINKRPVQMDVNTVKDRICRMQGDNAASVCQPGNSLTTFQLFIIVTVMAVVFIAIAGLYRLYIHIRMRQQIKSDIDKTLEQYYKYMQAFDGKETSTEKKPSRPLTEQLEEDPQLIKEANKQNQNIELRDIRK